MSGRYERVLAALDGGSTQRLVLEKAVELANEGKSSLMLVHVVPYLPTTTSTEVVDAICVGAREGLEAELADLLAEIREEVISSYELKVYAGGVSSTLLDRAVKEFNPDLVICGDRGLSNLKYALWGSVSSALVRHAECDVLVVKNRNR